MVALQNDPSSDVERGSKYTICPVGTQTFIVLTHETTSFTTLPVAPQVLFRQYCLDGNIVHCFS